ncbi:uncharacterized protein BX664DRAFT_335183 [Halteromyces radiatus]|uniref:uncharacterized protein n=1 Tax=Halteromyces radiatus TaxID=101107 RepID=UPI00221FBF29|nr:uncharacterized protein BX664DRAFT_335183 [Halteromyces radiatus]KAI8086211.1 hypothetical protein BX664DRAFT_335183 [Halteromyces radiatus]
MTETTRPEREVAARKWINDNESDSDQEVGLVPHNRGYKLKGWAASDSQFGGNKLRAPKSLAEETELIKAGKKHTVVKRKRRFLEEEASDEEDPYTLINIEDILSPIETPTDIVQRPALRRILKSKQIDALAGTAMEFIEGEKNFNKVLCRLSSILHQDDPQYLDLDFESNDKTDGNNKTGQEEDDETIKDESIATDPIVKKEEEDVNTNAAEVVRHVKELLLENINYSNEYLSRLQGARDKLTKARLQKDALYNELQSQLTEQRRLSATPRRR